MSPLAIILYALSALILAGCAGAIVHHQWREWKKSHRSVGEVKVVLTADTSGYEEAMRRAGRSARSAFRPEYRWDPERPIFSELAAQHPDVVRTILRARQRRFLANLGSNTGNLNDAFKRLGEQVRAMQQSMGRALAEGLIRVPPPVGRDLSFLEREDPS